MTIPTGNMGRLDVRFMGVEKKQDEVRNTQAVRPSQLFMAFAALVREISTITVAYEFSKTQK